MKNSILLLIATLTIFQLACLDQDDDTILDLAFEEGVYYFEYFINNNKVRVDPYFTESYSRSDTLYIKLKEEDGSFLTIRIDGVMDTGIYMDARISAQTAPPYVHPFCGKGTVEIDTFISGELLKGTFEGGTVFLDCDAPPSIDYTNGVFRLLHKE